MDARVGTNTNRYGAVGLVRTSWGGAKVPRSLQPRGAFSKQNPPDRRGGFWCLWYVGSRTAKQFNTTPVAAWAGRQAFSTIQNYAPHRRFLVLCAKSPFVAIAALHAGYLTSHLAPRTSQNL